MILSVEVRPRSFFFYSYKEEILPDNHTCRLSAKLDIARKLAMQLRDEAEKIGTTLLSEKYQDICIVAEFVDDGDLLEKTLWENGRWL